MPPPVTTKILYTTSIENNNPIFLSKFLASQLSKPENTFIIESLPTGFLRIRVSDMEMTEEQIRPVVDGHQYLTQYSTINKTNILSDNIDTATIIYNSIFSETTVNYKVWYNQDLYSFGVCELISYVGTLEFSTSIPGIFTIMLQSTYNPNYTVFYEVQVNPVE